MAYYHMSQIKSLGKVVNIDRQTHYFSGVVLKEGAQSTDKPFPKSDYLRVEGEDGWLADDSESYRDVMDFQHEWAFLKK